jgi:predicted regulator of Ras-like GTPase activity (Roadblock/LC7/MglB family)
MIFNDILRSVVQGTPGGAGAVLMGMDGIAIGEHVTEKGFPIQTVGVEYASAIKNIRSASRALEAGDLDEVTIRTEAAVFLLRLVTPEFFVAMALSPEGNAGKARYLLRLSIPQLVRELS